MIVPEFWAEARERVVIDGKSRTYRRFGWSDDSEADALENATERVREAAARARAGEKVRLADHKVAYNGAEGLPIREEIIERHGDTLITRNSYGALCLNTPDVLFADVDIEPRGHAAIGWIVFLFILPVGWLLKIQLDSWWPFAVAVVLGAFVAEPIGRKLADVMGRARDDPFDLAMSRFEEYALRNPRWIMRVYRTPLGFRLLAMHKTFSPEEEEAFLFMQAVGSDRLYMQMCRNQKCFRARVSPKPWRIGIDHIRPRPGIWPIRDERLPERRAWVKRYDLQAKEYASCRYEQTLGTGLPSRKCESVRSLHDKLCRVDAELPIA
ncbi:MAG: hypothetical protein KJO31_06740 [Gammaproteobacteria bacterium]|nr:hypothetical protein [Gammaproteobacteria bacterium]